MRVDGIQASGEPTCDQVVQDLAADRPASPRRAHHRHRPRRQESAHRRDRRGPFAFLKALDRRRRQRGRQLDLDRVPGAVTIDRKPALAKDVDHPVIDREHLSVERGDPASVGDRREMREHDRRDSPSLPGVGDQERHLGPALVDPHIRRVGHDLTGRAGLGDEPEPVRVIDIQRPRGHPLQISGAEEPKSDRLTRDALQEGADGRLVRGSHRPDVNRRAVTQRDVHFTLGRIWDGGGDRDAHRHRSIRLIGALGIGGYYRRSRGPTPIPAHAHDHKLAAMPLVTPPIVIRAIRPEDKQALRAWESHRITPPPRHVETRRAPRPRCATAPRRPPAVVGASATAHPSPTRSPGSRPAQPGHPPAAPQS